MIPRASCVFPVAVTLWEVNDACDRVNGSVRERTQYGMVLPPVFSLVVASHSGRSFG